MPEQNTEQPSGTLGRLALLEREMVERAIRECEELESFDAMEIARALLAVAFALVGNDVDGPEYGLHYFQHLKNSCEQGIAQRDAFVSECARNHMVEEAASAERGHA